MYPRFVKESVAKEAPIQSINFFNLENKKIYVSNHEEFQRKVFDLLCHFYSLDWAGDQTEIQLKVVDRKSQNVDVAYTAIPWFGTDPPEMLKWNCCVIVKSEIYFRHVIIRVRESVHLILLSNLCDAIRCHEIKDVRSQLSLAGMLFLFISTTETYLESFIDIGWRFFMPFCSLKVQNLVLKNDLENRPRSIYSSIDLQ